MTVKDVLDAAPDTGYGIVELCKNRTPVIYQGEHYRLCGYQVDYEERETIKSLLLRDQRNCVLWINYNKMGEIEIA